MSQTEDHGLATGPAKVAPVRPGWKTPRHLHEKQEIVGLCRTTVGEALPGSVHRLGWLEERDAQLRQLLDHLQTLGVPMGSSKWALHALLRIRRLEAESAAAKRVLNSTQDGEPPDMERLRRDLDHAQAMHAKHIPATELRCDWCGWPGPATRLIGDGLVACTDCLALDHSG